MRSERKENDEGRLSWGPEVVFITPQEHKKILFPIGSSSDSCMHNEIEMIEDELSKLPSQCSLIHGGYTITRNGYIFFSLKYENGSYHNLVTSCPNVTTGELP